MTSSALATTLDAIVEKAAARGRTRDIRMAVDSPDVSWTYREPGTPERYFVASITKLATAAVVFQHVDEGRYGLDTPAHTLLPSGTLSGLHGMGAEDRTHDVTIEHLLAHTSGIADYFETAKRGDATMIERIVRDDLAWGPHDALDMVRGRAAHCSPGQTKKAFYSDTNYQLLQLVIEAIDGPYGDTVAKRICTPLGLSDTFVFTREHLDQYGRIARIRYGADLLDIPRAMASFGADGSMVSTTADQLVFLRAFMSGDLFARETLLHATARWRPMFFPLEYGVGMMRYRLPRTMSPFSPMPPPVGHSGATGAVLFYDAGRDLVIAGSVNQLKHRSIAFQLMSRLERALR